MELKGLAGVAATHFFSLCHFTEHFNTGEMVKERVSAWVRQSWQQTLGSKAHKIFGGFAAQLCTDRFYSQMEITAHGAARFMAEMQHTH